MSDSFDFGSALLNVSAIGSQTIAAQTPVFGLRFSRPTALSFCLRLNLSLRLAILLFIQSNEWEDSIVFAFYSFGDKSMIYKNSLSSNNC